MGTMAQSMNLLVPAFLLLLVQGARSEKCTPSSLEVGQTNTGDQVGYDPVFEVTVRNRCECAVRGVVLRSEGFITSLPIDPKLFRQEGRGYLVGDGSRIKSQGEVRFRYAWDRAFQMSADAVQDDCS